MADGTSGTESKSSNAPDAVADKDHISALLLELGGALAIVDLLYMVSNDSDVEAMLDGTLGNSLHIVMERLHAAKAAAESILAERRPVGLKQGVAHHG